MSGAFLLAFGLLSEAIGAAVAGLPWVAIATAAAALPYAVVGLYRFLS